MNHKDLYEKFIESRKLRLLPENCKTEEHHILPKSLGGGDTKENLIHLTFREHYIAHLILWKLHSGKMSQAFWLMNNRGPRISKTSRMYSQLKEDKFSIEVRNKSSVRMKKTWSENYDVMYQACLDRREEVSKQMKGNKYRLGLPTSEKQKEATRRANTGKKDKPETTEKRRENRLGLMSITNGKENMFIKPSEEIPEGFYQGQTANHKNTSTSAKEFRKARKEIGEKWINKDGVTKFILVTELDRYLEQGWQMGRKRKIA